MESDTKRIKQISDKPIKGDPAPVITPQLNNQEKMVPINMQQSNLQPNQVNAPQLQNSITQPIIYQQLYNQPVIIQPGHQNIIVSNQGVPVSNETIKFTKRRENMVCPYCGNLIKTNVELNFNCFKCCIFFLCIILIIFAGCNGSCDCNCKDCCCCCCCCCCYQKKEEPEPEPEPADECCTCFDDATHSCPVCKQILGESGTC
jgi:hypothetical protein